MPYPTMEAVEAADKMQLAKWSRHLPSPGEARAGHDDFEEVCAAETAVLDRLLERFAEAGGWNPDLSKAVGW